MTAKEKAIQLVEKYDETLTYLESKSKAKQCALIAVDEILNSEPKKAYFIKGSWMTPNTYWKEVKQEIEKL